MKIKRGNLLTVILAMLCAAAVALGVGFALPKNEVKTAQAASTELIKSDGSKYDSTALDALASAAGYDDINAMLDDLDAGTILTASNFGSHGVTIGGKQWWPVYASGTTLTLWLKEAIGPYSFSDGTYSNITSVNPAPYDYTYSWIRSAINMGCTDNSAYSDFDDGDYYGKWGGTGSSTSPTKYHKEDKAPQAAKAPKDFTDFADFVDTGKYCKFIIKQSFGDNLSLPTLQEVSSSGSWGCTTTQWANNGSSKYAWTCTLSPDSAAPHYGAYAVHTSGTNISKNVYGTHGIRPKITLDISTARRASVGAVEVTYDGNLRDIADTEITADKKKWYDSSLMNLTYPTANTTDMINAGTYSVKVELNATAVAAKYIFRGDADPSKGDGDESDIVRYFDFKIKPKPLPVPEITNSPQTYDPTKSGNSFAVDKSKFDSSTMNAVPDQNAAKAPFISWNSTTECFDVTKVGTYTVEFELQDKNNYVWDVGTGTTGNQPKTLKLDPKKLPVPTIQNPTQTYAPGGNSFDLVDKSKFDPSTMKAVPDPVTAANISWNSGNICFDVTKAGTYTVKFELLDKDNYVWDVGANGTTDDRTPTLTVEKIKLPVPTVQNTTQTYDPAKNGCYFSVSSDFDATTMNAETVPSTSTDIIWNAASTRFEAKKAGTHTVQFVLKDKDNYLWDVGTNGDKTDQPKTLKVDPKSVDLPTVSADQQYTGTALQFMLSSDFDDGKYISMDGVTSANGSTVTGAGGSSITDTTDTFEAIKVDTYTVSLSLRNSTNYVWSDGTALPKTVQFEVTQKELLTTPPVSSKVNGTNGAEWEFGDSSVTITITDARVTGENINLFCYYDVQGGTSKSNTLTATTTGNVTTITMPTNIAVGKYTLTVELNGSTGDNANYKITQNNTLNFKVTSGKLDPTTYDWTYEKEGTAVGIIADGTQLPFELKAGSATDGVKYELSIQIPSSDSFVTVDTTKHTSGYLTRSGDSVNTFKTVVALKSTDPNNLFEVDGNKQDTCEVELNWEIVKGTFNLTNVKWEYSLNGSTGWTEYNPANPPQYNDGYDITVRVKASTLPLGLTLDSLYKGVKESDVNNHTATISASDFVYNSANFNAPNTSSLTLNWQIAKKNLFKGFKNVSEPFSNAQYSGNMIIKQLDLDSTFAGYIDYTYYLLPANTLVTLQDIKDAVDLTNPHNYKVEVNIKPAYAANYTVDDNGSIPSDQFKTGSNNKLANAAIDNATVVYDGNTHFDVSHVTVTGSDSMNVTDFTVKYYKGTTPVAANALAAGELPKDAGDYCIEVILGTMAESKYMLVTDRLTVTIEAMGIAVPTLGTITFNGNEHKFEDYLSGESWTTYGPAGMNIIKVDGKISDRNVGATNYTTTLELTDSNYKWIDPSTVSSTKAVVKYVLAADEVKPTVNGDCTVATYEWNIKPLIVDSTNMWNKGSKGATLNLPQNIKDLIAGGTLEVGYRYYDSDGVFVETPEMKSGRSFKVEAVFGGDDSARNVQFKRSDTEFGLTSKSIDYTVPTSGAAAFLGKVKDALSKTWLGLPIWAWLLIALALLILLIVIIVVAAKRRKTKEEREEIKARKEEERQRREDERRMQQERLEAERELARARQEAELEKIRAQAQMTAGAGMAAMAMQQPVQQAQMVDSGALARIEAEIARINEKIANQQSAQQYMPVPMQQQMMPQYYQQMPMMSPMMPMQMGGGEYSDLRADVRSMREEQRSDREVAALKKEMELEFAKMRNGGSYGAKAPAQIAMSADQESDGQAVQGNSAQMMGAIMAAFVKNMAAGNYVAPATEAVQEPEKEEKPNVANIPASYPSNAVITTTTTVDTTKSSTSRSSQSDDGRMFDIDGFYDTFEGNK